MYYSTEWWSCLWFPYIETAWRDVLTGFAPVKRQSGATSLQAFTGDMQQSERHKLGSQRANLPTRMMAIGSFPSLSVLVCWPGSGYRYKKKQEHRQTRLDHPQTSLTNHMEMSIIYVQIQLPA
jgi:hypothetical protein